MSDPEDVQVTEDAQLTEEEKELYDRQIRLWGYDSQKRLREGKVLLIGVGGLGAEIVKNLVLAGIKSITLMDTELGSDVDKINQFLIPNERFGENRAVSSTERAQALNPLVKVTADTEDIFTDKPEDFVKDFSIVVATGLSHTQVLKLSERCREHNVKIYICNVTGLFGYALIDIGDHTFFEQTVTRVPVVPSEGSPDKGGPAKFTEVTKSVKKSITYPSIVELMSVDFTKPENMARIPKLEPYYFIIKGLLEFREQMGRDPHSEAFEVDIELIKSIVHSLASSCSYPLHKISDELLETMFVNVNVACAIVGGVIGQEVIKVLSQVGEPLRNILFFDPLKSVVGVSCLGC